MFQEGVVGVQNLSDTSRTYARYGKQGEQIASELHGRFYEQTYRGNVFSLNTQGTAVTTTAALATTWTGLGFANPAGSGVNAVLIAYGATQFAVGAASTIGLAGAAGVITSTLTPQSRVIGAGQVSKMNGSAGATISTPLLIGTYGSVGSAATTAIPIVQGIFVELAGSIIIPPGSFIVTYTSIITTSALNFQLVWEEIPV